MKKILSILLIIFIALTSIACVSASDINETVDQDLIVSDLDTLIPIDDSAVISDTNLGNETEEDSDSIEIDNSTEPSEEDIVVDNSTEVVENDTVDNKSNPIVGPTIPDNNKTDENQSSEDIKVLTDDELNDIARENIAHFMEKREYWINCNYPPEWGINPTYNAMTSISLEFNKTYGADYTIDIITRMVVMVMLDNDPDFSLIPSSLKPYLLPALVEELHSSVDYCIRSYWDDISNKSGLDWDDLNPTPGRKYDPRFDPCPKPNPFEPVDPKC